MASFALHADTRYLQSLEVPFKEKVVSKQIADTLGLGLFLNIHVVYNPSNKDRQT